MLPRHAWPRIEAQCTIELTAVPSHGELVALGRAFRATAILAEPVAEPVLDRLVATATRLRGLATDRFETETSEALDRAWQQLLEPAGLARLAIERERAESLAAAIEALHPDQAAPARALRGQLGIVDADLEDALLVEDESARTRRVFEEPEPGLESPTLLETWLARLALPDAWWAAPLLGASVRADARAWAGLDEELREDLLERLLFFAMPAEWMTALPAELRRRHRRATAWNRELIGLGDSAGRLPPPWVVALSRAPVVPEARLSGGRAPARLGPGRHELELPAEIRPAWCDGHVTVQVGASRVDVRTGVPPGAAPPSMRVELLVNGEPVTDGRLGPGAGDAVTLIVPEVGPQAELALGFAIEAADADDGG